MKRKLAFLEASLYAEGAVSNHVVATVKIKGSISEMGLRLALSKVQSRHPLLQARIAVEEGGHSYFVNDLENPQIALDIRERENDEDWKNVFIPACVLPFHVGIPLMRVIWFQSERISDLMFVCHHCICDGKSILNLIDETLQVLAKPDLELGSYDATAPISDYIPDASKNNSANQFIKRILPPLTKFALLFASMRGYKLRDQPYFIHWKLNSDLSAAVMAKCKKESVSVHAVLSVLYLTAFQYHKKSKKHQKLYCSVDMRRFIPQITSHMLFAFPAMIPLRLNLSKRIDIWEEARRMQQNLKKRLDKIDVYGPLIYTEGLIPLISKIIRYAKKDEGSHAFTFSNMGRAVIKEQYQTLLVEALYSPACIFPYGNPSTLCVTSFRECLDFLFTSDNHFLSQQEAFIIRDKAMELLSAIVKTT